MKKKLSTCLVLAILVLNCYVLAKEPYFLSCPALSTDGKTVVFSYAGDLWTVPEKGGAAARLTDMPGYETSARFSPDGKWIAFTGRRSGNADIYLISTGSKQIRQLTYHSSADEVSSWSWDSRFIYFSSDRTGQLSGYKISSQGGTPVRVLGNYYFQNDHNLVEDPVSGAVFFNDTWESSYQVNRKRYKGPFNPDIQSYDTRSKQYKRYTDYEGKDFGATIDRKGNIYFVSDQHNGEFNLYTFRKGKKTALTHFSTSIKTPNASAEGSKVVFEKDYQLFIYEVKTGKIRKIVVSLPGGTLPDADRELHIKGNITGVDVSSDGKRLAFTSRGELFVCDADGSSVKKVDKASFERAIEVKWMADGRTLLFNQTGGGYLNWYTVSAEGGETTALTKDRRNNRQLSLNADKSMAVYLSGIDEVRLLNLKTGMQRTIVRDEIWAMFADKAAPRFSPDGRYVCYTAHRNSEEDIFLYDLVAGTTQNLTHTGVTETGPEWSPDGKYIYFSASPLSPAFPYGMQNAGIYRLALRQLNAPFRSENSITDTITPPPIPTVVIDTAGIIRRIEQVGPNFGSNFLADIVQTGPQTDILLISNQERGEWAVWKTALKPFSAERTEKMSGGPVGRNVNLQISRNGNTCFAVINGSIYRLFPAQNKMEPLVIDYVFTKTLRSEFNQMFFEAWAKVEENYYDDTFHGTDWKFIKDQYARYLPFINTRSDFRTLMNDMLGELNSSHQRFNTYGEEEAVPDQAVSMETGIIFKDSNPYIVDRIIGGSAADKMDITLLPGDELVGVDSIQVDQHVDRDFYFTRPSFSTESELEFRRGNLRFKTKIHPQRSLSDNLHDEWIEKNRRRVASRSKNRIVYACMKNMERPEFDRFLVEMSRNLEGKNGLILDLRYNDGGQMHDELLKFLSQRSYAQWKYRGGKSARQGHFTPSDKPIVLLMNQQTLSDGEMTAAGFKALKLGKLVGSETYHWEIFTRPYRLVDGSSVRISAWGCYSLDGADLELTGVSPDIEVKNTFEDNINGRDPQLDRALLEVMK